jgi:hypothetical protein
MMRPGRQVAAFGLAVHLVIDNDVCKSTSLRIPAGSVGQPSLQSVLFDRPLSHVPLEELVHEEAFRSDLFYRLNVVSIFVPPLRENKEDIPVFVDHFLQTYAKSMNRPVPKVSKSAMDILLAYNWPGNVRELERLMERVVALGGTDAVELDDLPPSVRGETATMVSALDGKDTMRAWGSRYARLVLDRSGGNKRDACRVLGISYHTLNAYLRYPLHQEPDRPVRWVDSGRDDGSGSAQAEVEVAEV